MVLLSGSYQHGPPLLGWVLLACRSPPSWLIFGPPTPCQRQPRLRFPSPSAYLDGGRLFLTGNRVHPRTRLRRRWVTGPPYLPEFSSRKGQGLPGYGAVLFMRAADKYPARPAISLPLSAVMTVLLSSSVKPWATWELPFQGWLIRPTSSPVYASAATLPASLQDWLPACWAQLWLGGFCTRWTTIPNFKGASTPPFLSDQHCLVASTDCAWPHPLVAGLHIVSRFAIIITALGGGFFPSDSPDTAPPLSSGR